jgi:cytochrome c-type biogenesis protein CcmH/NrfG
VRTKVTVAVMAVVVLFYAAFIAVRGVGLLRDGSPVAVVLGLALLVLPVLGVVLVWREVQFGRRTAVLAATLEREGALPVDDLPRRPSGRVDRAAADGLFARMREEAEQRPDDWRSWFRLALAYDAAGDRTRGREAARHAVALHDRSPG